MIYIKSAYWKITLACIACTLAIEMLRPRMSPTSFRAEGIYKLALIPPLALCWWISIYYGGSIGFRSRLYSGLLQSLVLVCHSFREYEYRAYRTFLGVSGDDSPLRIGLMWTGLILGYTCLFSMVTSLFAALMQTFFDQKTKRDGPMCKQCGYSLRGLTIPRCPECGTPFPSSLLKENGSEKASG